MSVGLPNQSSYRPYSVRDIDRSPLSDRLSAAQRRVVKVVGHVLPFRANNYVLDELIDWEQIPDDPIFQLTFPQEDMLAPEARARMARALDEGSAAESPRVARCRSNRRALH